MELDNNTLFAANVIILLVMALAFFLAYLSQQREKYWLSWLSANIALAGALLIFIFQAAVPEWAVGTAAHGLLLLGFGLRYKAAREFSGRSSSPALIYGPTALFVIFSFLPFVAARPGFVFTVINILLALTTLLVAIEFWRDRDDRLPSRFGLCAVYILMGASFGMRAIQGLVSGSDFVVYLPLDAVLTAHLLVALIHTVGSGAFALGIAYERGAVQLRKDARSDSLTQLLNRRAFEEQINMAIEQQDRRPFALILLDIDHFKRINDRFGHAVGDEALRLCADIFRKTLRANDIVARIGGEEFAAILHDVDAAHALAVAERVRQALGDVAVETRSGPVNLTLSAGLYFSRTGPADFDTLIQAADIALYRAKRNGRNRVEMAA